YADALTTVSPTYALEIQTATFGEGLDGLLRARANVLTGILNGCDYDVWNPETDPLIPARYSARDMSGKLTCKRELLRAFELPADLSVPVIGIVSRFAWQKGFELIGEIAQRLFLMPVRLVVLGSGEAPIEE